MNVNDIFPSRFLKGGDLRGPVTVTIKGVASERMHKPGVGEVNGWVMYCEKGSKGIVLSRPLALAIAESLNELDTDKWPGRQVVLFPQPMRVGGRDLIAIRAREVNGARAADSNQANGGKQSDGDK